MQIKLFNNEQLESLTPEWRYWWPTVAVYFFHICKVKKKKNSDFQRGYVIIIWDEETMNHCKKVYQFKTIFYLVGHNFYENMRKICEVSC